MKVSNLQKKLIDMFYSLEYEPDSHEDGVGWEFTDWSANTVADRIEDLIIQLVGDFLYERYGADKGAEEFSEWLENYNG